MVSFWYRSDFCYATETKYDILSACGGDFDDGGRRDRILDELAARKDQCTLCVGESFSSPYLRSLRDHCRKDAHAFLHRSIPLLAMNSTIVERKHLIGQGQTKQGKRGRAVSATELASRSYAQSVQDGHRAHMARKEATVLPPPAHAKRSCNILSVQQSSARRAARRCRTRVLKQRAVRYQRYLLSTGLSAWAGVLVSRCAALNANRSCSDCTRSGTT